MAKTFIKLITLLVLVLLSVAQPLSSITSTSSSSSSSSTIDATASSPFSTPISGNWRMNTAAGYNTNISVTITNNAISFRYCNQQSYKYQVSGGRITITGDYSTQIYCKMAAPPTEDQIKTALTSAYSYSVNGNSLTLRNSAGTVVASLTRQSSTPTPPVIPQPTTSIVGNWTATNVKGQTVSFAVTIDASSLRYRYCNSKSIGYTISGNQLTFTSGMSTMMACIGLNPTEEFVSSAFSSVRSFRLSGNILSLLDQNGATVVTLREGPAPITGNYIISMINNVGTLELNKVKVSVSPTAFSFTYCNGKQFPYTVTGNNISVQSGISTMMFCQGLSPTENEVNKAFTDARTYQMNGNTLSLIGADGRTKVVLLKQ